MVSGGGAAGGKSEAHRSKKGSGRDSSSRRGTGDNQQSHQQ